VHHVLDEMIMGGKLQNLFRLSAVSHVVVDPTRRCVVVSPGMVLETSSKNLVSAIRDMKKLEDFSDKMVAKEKAARQTEGGRKF